MHVDLNADVGEGVGGTAELDRGVLSYVTSANIACGVHAGSPELMRATVELARDCNVAIGAHPSFPDHGGFGRQDMHLTSSEIESLVLYQLGALSAIAGAEGTQLRHVKPHGALYTMAARDRTLADAIARAVRLFDRELILVGLAGSAVIGAARDAGLRPAEEGFIDRAYRADGTLVPRGEDGAVLREASAAVAQAVRMVCDGAIVTATGHVRRVRVDSLCVHGDTPGAAALAAAVRGALRTSGVDVLALGTN